MIDVLSFLAGVGIAFAVFFGGIVMICAGVGGNDAD